MKQHGLHNPKQSCNLKDINTTRSGPGEMLISSANKQLTVAVTLHTRASAASVRLSSRWLTGWQEGSQPSTPSNKPGAAQWPAWKTHYWEAITSWERKMCLGHLHTNRATGVTALSGSHYYDDIANDNKHKIKTKPHSPTATVVALHNDSQILFILRLHSLGALHKYLLSVIGT